MKEASVNNSGIKLQAETLTDLSVADEQAQQTRGGAIQQGRSGSDLLHGGAGDDVVLGGAGLDVLIADTARDRL